ncbi:MAG: type II secretion system protein, partial [Dehalococcoidia bacterium]
MKSIFRIRLPRLGRKESGFTLVELLVVVGIIVALAAVIVPSIAAVSGKGEQGARDSERENVQSAMDTLMADIGITTVNANDLLADSSVADFSTTGFGDLDPGAGT